MEDPCLGLRLNMDSQKLPRKALAVTAVLLIVLAVGIAFVYSPTVPTAAHDERIVRYTLTVKEVKLTQGDKSWDAWTYNGQVPGPILTGRVGDVLEITLVNKGTKVHSLHTHLTSYGFENDGSQANVIMNKGAGSMVPPGKQFTFRYNLTEPGIFYYHCHSADGAHIAMHIRMGLYGAILVKDLGAPNLREEVIFYGEGQPEAPAFFVINNRGIPGGEKTLEAIFKDKGLPGVVAQLNVSVTAFTFRVGETVRLHIINIGDFVHSHHGHGHSIRSTALGGRPWPANVLPLVPGQADSLEITFTEPGLWLFHCHVVSHADAGMIGVFLVA